MARPVRWRLAAVVGGLALLTVACGSSSSSAPGGTPSPAAPSSSAPAAAGSSPSSALCADAAALRASLSELTHIKVQKGMQNEITAKLANAKTALTAFVNEAHGQWQTETAALKSALTNVETAVKGLTANPSVSAVGAVTSALREVSSATASLLTTVSTTCPSASPSPSS